MADRIFVATRKGLFEFRRSPTDRSGWKINKVSFLGEGVSVVLPDARDGSVYAALNLGHFGVKLHRSDDDGASFREIAVPEYPAMPAGETDPRSWSVQQVWSLEAGGASDAGTLWAGTIPGGLFASGDRGESWQLVESLWNRPDRSSWSGGGYDYPGIHSICVDPRNPQCVTLGVSIGGVWRTSDAGASWEPRAAGMWAEYVPPDLRGDVNQQDPHRVAQCTAHPDVLWAQHHNGAFRSDDAGVSWRELRVTPSVFGFPVAAHPSDPGTAWFVPAVKDECRVPVDGRLVVARTRDGGETFDELRDGLPQHDAFDLVYRHGLDVDESGERLAMGSTTGNLWLSDDGGDRWQCLATHLPPIHAVRFAP